MSNEKDLVPTTDEHGREIFVYAKGKAPKEKPRYSTRPLTGTAPKEKPTPKPKE